jgi:death on curing protein
MGGTCQALSIQDIIEINRRMIVTFGGKWIGVDNLVNPGSLEHVLEEIQGSVFEQEVYPGIVEKAAVLGWRIITGHIFNDGNKRTGLEACRLFLDLNGYTMIIDRDALEMALATAKGQVQFSEFVEWLRVYPKNKTD